MQLKLFAILLVMFSIVVVGYGTWRRIKYPQTVLSTGTIKFTDPTGQVAMFPTRVIAVGGFETMQIQLPGLTWIDCRGDCTATLKAEHAQIWETQMLNR